MTKVVFLCFDEAHFKRTGESYQVGVFEDDYVAEYPYTDVPIPDELQASDKVAFFNSQTKIWEDHSEDAEIQLAKKRQEDLAAAKQDAADAKANAESLQKALDQANADIELSNQATTELTNILFSVADQDKLAAAMGMTADTTTTTEEATQNA